MYIFNRVTVVPKLPKRIEKLTEISNNLWWAWNTELLRLFQEMDVTLWEKTKPVPANGTRICIANKNIPNMVGQITTVLADAKCNIAAMVNQNRADVAYNIIDVENAIDDAVAAKLKAIEGVIAVRLITANA